MSALRFGGFTCVSPLFWCFFLIVSAIFVSEKVALDVFLCFIICILHYITKTLFQQ